MFANNAAKVAQRKLATIPYRQELSRTAANWQIIRSLRASVGEQRKAFVHIGRRRTAQPEPINRGRVVVLPSSIRSFKMIRKVIGTAFLAAAIIAPLSASAQGVPGGVERGAREGERAAGPVGAIVGGTIGGVVGGVTAILGADQRPRFHRYVVEERRPSYRYEGDVRVGAELPEAGVTYYEVPAEYGVREYRYTVVNDRPVLVDPRTHRIVQVVE